MPLWDHTCALPLVRAQAARSAMAKRDLVTPVVPLQNMLSAWIHGSCWTHPVYACTLQYKTVTGLTRLPERCASIALQTVAIRAADTLIAAKHVCLG